MKNARDNARLNGIGNAQFLAGDAGEMMAEGIHMLGRPDIVLLDPPRKGCDKALIDSILDARAKESGLCFLRPPPL